MELKFTGFSYILCEKQAGGHSVTHQLGCFLLTCGNFTSLISHGFSGIHDKSMNQNEASKHIM